MIKGHKENCKCSFCNNIGKNNPMFGRKHSEESLRKMRESKLGKKNPFFGKKHTVERNKIVSEKNKGENSGTWKGGVTPLISMIRNHRENTKWKISVFERDNYKCKKCLKSHCHLEAHHKKSFKIIFYEFLQKYSQFSPIEEKEILMRLSLSHEDFWDINNGETLCKECHDETKRGILT